MMQASCHFPVTLHSHVKMGDHKEQMRGPSPLPCSLAGDMELGFLRGCFTQLGDSR
jgi:hypothetical protein